MTLVQLRHLIALADHGSFSQAAQAVFLSQPAFSRSIQALEDELGLRLADRIGRRVEFTAQGLDTVQRARQIVADSEELLAHSQRQGSAVSGTLRLGLGSGPGALLMTALMNKAVTEYPQLRLEIVRGATDLLVQSLRDRSLDALVVDARSLRPAPDLLVEQPADMRGGFLVRRGHPLTRLRRPLTLADVQRFAVASTPLSDEISRILVQRYGPQAHPDRLFRLRCTELSSLLELAQGSDTVVVAVRAAAPQLVELPMSPPLEAWARFGLVTLHRRTASPALGLVRELIAERLRD